MPHHNGTCRHDSTAAQQYDETARWHDAPYRCAIRPRPDGETYTLEQRDRGKCFCITKSEKTDLVLSCCGPLSCCCVDWCRRSLVPSCRASSTSCRCRAVVVPVCAVVPSCCSRAAIVVPLPLSFRRAACVVACRRSCAVVVPSACGRAAIRPHLGKVSHAPQGVPAVLICV